VSAKWDGFRLAEIRDGERMVTYSVRDRSPVSLLFDSAPEMQELLQEVLARGFSVPSSFTDVPADGLVRLHQRIRALLARNLAAEEPST
jgi:hypothetical protein